MCPGARAYVKHKPYCRIINFSYALMQWYYAGAHRKLTQTGYALFNSSHRKVNIYANTDTRKQYSAFAPGQATKSIRPRFCPGRCGTGHGCAGWQPGRCFPTCSPEALWADGHTPAKPDAWSNCLQQPKGEWSGGLPGLVC